MPDDEIYDPPSDSDGNDLEDDGVLDASDTLDGDPGDDPLDQGIVPPDRWSAGEGFGTTLSEERAGESLDQLLAQEERTRIHMRRPVSALTARGPMMIRSHELAGWLRTMREHSQMCNQA